MLAALALSLQTPKIVVPAVETRAELRLTVDHPVVGKDEDPGYHATIRNTGRKPLRLSDLQSGSELESVNPRVAWITPDLRDAEPLLFCGNHGPIDEHRFFTLAPGESREVGTDWEMARLSPGTNRVSFTYTIAPQKNTTFLFGMAFAINMPPEEKAEQERIRALYQELTPIRLTSDVVRVTLKTAP